MRAAKYFVSFVKPEGSPVQMTVLHRNKADNDAENYAKIFADVTAVDGVSALRDSAQPRRLFSDASVQKKKLGTCLKEKPEGTFVAAWAAAVAANEELQTVDVTAGLGQALSVKDAAETVRRLASLSLFCIHITWACRTQSGPRHRSLTD
jgi:nucleosome binding factor SPN SPT16 subunit